MDRLAQGVDSIRLAADVGGTFTDVVLDTGEEYFPSKIATTIETPKTASLARRQIAQQRDFLSAQIKSLGLTVVPSQTNFVLVDFETPDSAASAFNFLRNHGLVVRPMGGYGLAACLRITIGTGEQMQLTAKTLAAWQDQHHE